MIKFYKILSDILFIPILMYFILRLFLSKENLDSIEEKFFFKKKKRPKGDLVWINGVSIGEAKTALIIAEQIKKNYPKSKILLSTSTITSFRLISKMKKNFILIYSPLDINFIIKRFIRHWKPNSTIFIESEIWPNIFFELKKNYIKLILVNARISKKSFINWMKLKYFAKIVFKQISECFVQDNDSLKRFKLLGVEEVKKIENIKFLSERLDYDKKTYNLLKNKLKGKRIVTLFSSHNGEEEIMLNCFMELSNKISNLFIIIIPRHLDRLGKITEVFEKRRVSYQVGSSDNKIINKKNFLIVNTFGQLGLFFKLSEIALVGGSFTNFGGHNPIETKGFECSLIFGKYMQNFKDVKDQIIKKKAGLEARDSKQLNEQLKKLLNNENLRIKTYTNFKKLCDDESRNSKLILNEIFK